MFNAIGRSVPRKWFVCLVMYAHDDPDRPVVCCYQRGDNSDPTMGYDWHMDRQVWVSRDQHVLLSRQIAAFIQIP